MILSKKTSCCTIKVSRFFTVGSVGLACVIAVLAGAQQPQPASDAAQASSTQTARPPIEDEATRSSAILAHLNAVLRFYRDTEAPIQKVGQPSDTVYRDQAVAQALRAAGYAFQSAKAEASLMESSSAGQPAAAGGSSAQRLQQTRADVEQRIVALKAQDAELAKQIDTARPKLREALQQERAQVQGELELQTAMADALGKIATMGELSNETGFAARVNQLERSAPGLAANKASAVAPTLETVSSVNNAGVTTQARVIFDLIGTRQAIDNLLKESNALHKQTAALRAPLITLLKNTVAQGQTLAQNADANAPATDNAGKSGAASSTSSTLKTFNQLTATFKAISGATIPLSQELLTLEENQATLQAWRTSVNEEYLSILRALLVRVVFIGLALLFIFVLSDLWRRTTKRYVHDVRRRRQLLLVRRLLTAFLTGLVLIFGLVTQFSSLATFAGFITAGIAVGLQTILLSVAAYFFIVGRYGIKVGDRITIGGVTGDVVEVGLVRFYVMELAGSGTELFSTGRVAVFSNAVLFQAGTPLFKQMPGTQYAWHELTVKLAPGVDYRPALQEILTAMQKVYEGYRPQIEQQHKMMEVWIDSSLDAPGIQSNLQLVDGGLQFWARYPVMIRQAAAIDDKMTEALLNLIASDEKVKSAVGTSPVIKAAVKG